MPAAKPVCQCSAFGCCCCCAVQLNAEKLQLTADESCGLLHLEDSAAYQMPGDETIGPLHLTTVSLGDFLAGAVRF